jgi:uncharacterized Zn-finger protein
MKKALFAAFLLTALLALAGAEAQKFFCKYCGQDFPTLAALVNNKCLNHPQGRGYNHALYEGGEKREYSCKFCGQRFRVLRTLCLNVCPNNPAGRGKYHEPAL